MNKRILNSIKFLQKIVQRSNNKKQLIRNATSEEILALIETVVNQHRFHKSFSKTLHQDLSILQKQNWNDIEGSRNILLKYTSLVKIIVSCSLQYVMAKVYKVIELERYNEIMRQNGTNIDSFYKSEDESINSRVSAVLNLLDENQREDADVLLQGLLKGPNPINFNKLGQITYKNETEPFSRIDQLLAFLTCKKTKCRNFDLPGINLMLRAIKEKQIALSILSPYYASLLKEKETKCPSARPLNWTRYEDRLLCKNLIKPKYWFQVNKLNGQNR